MTSGGTKDNRLSYTGGLLSYVPAYGEEMPLYRVAKTCGYRLDTLCEELEISPRHLRRFFQETVGVQPKTWLRSERMVLARSMLRTSTTIKEVSKQLGFNDQKDFYREFRAFYEIAPSEFKARETNRVVDHLDEQR